MTRRHLLNPLILALIAALLPVTALSAPWYEPAGLNPGDQYQLAFVTSTTITACSDDINVYNAHVQAAATAASLPGYWKAIVSTPMVLAPVNAPVLFPLYNLNPTAQLVASDSADLWDGDLFNPIGYDESGVAVSRWVWTGTLLDGSRSISPVGYDISVTHGDSSRADSSWVNASTNECFFTSNIYAVSSSLTAVPLPGAVWLLGTGLVGLCVHRRKTRR